MAPASLQKISKRCYNHAKTLFDRKPSLPQRLVGFSAGLLTPAEQMLDSAHEAFKEQMQGRNLTNDDYFFRKATPLVLSSGDGPTCGDYPLVGISR
jgi:hypothetical protein